VLPTTLPLARFYQELVQTQAVLNRKHLGFAALRGVGTLALRLLLQGQTNFLRMLWKFRHVYNPERQYADHARPVRYALSPPPEPALTRPAASTLYVHTPRGGQRHASRPPERRAP
jgi:hypothetical protein